MRAFLLVFCMVVVVAAGCKKDLQSAPKIKTTVNSAVVGKWELRIQRGGLQPDKNFVDDNGNVVQFNADGTYVFYVADAVTQHGTFHIDSKAYSLGTQMLDLIFYDNTTNGEVIDVQDNMLTLGTSAADGLSSIYAKK